jgi:hypothetical protein
MCYCCTNNHDAAAASPAALRSNFGEEALAHQSAFGTMLAEIARLSKNCRPFANPQLCLFDAAA